MSVNPIQPFFTLNTTKYYKVHIPDSPIVHFYSFMANAENVHDITAVPDGCVDILISIFEGQAKGHIYGTVTKNRPLVVADGHYYLGVRFRPGYMPEGIDLSIPQLVDERVALEEMPYGRVLLESIQQTTDFMEHIAAMRTFFGEGEGWRTHELLQQVIMLVEQCDGCINISELSNETGYSSRYINRVFSDNLGISTKAFAKFMRFQSAMGILNNSSIENMADFAAEYGYYDQSHFIREFRDFADVTPGEYVRVVDPSSYSSKIRNIKPFSCADLTYA